MAVKRKQEKSLTAQHKKAKVIPDTVVTKKAPKPEKPKSKPKKRAPTPPPESEDSSSGSEDELDEIDDAEEEAEDDMSVDGAEQEDVDVDMDGEEDGEGNAEKTSDDPDKSRKAHAEQKRLAAERKAAKPKADIMHRSKKIWEQIRRRTLSKAERKPLIEELQRLIKGQISDLVFKHDLSRVVQTALKYGDKPTREAIAKELKGKYVELSQSGYGKYLVAKVMHYGTPETRSMVVEEFYGSVRKLIKHREASFIIEDCFTQFGTPTQKAKLLREFYGIEFALFKNEDEPTMSLKEILARTPEKRATIMKSLFELLHQVVEKGAFFFAIVHRAMLEYITNSQPGATETVEFIELIKEHIGEIAFTPDGSQVVMRCLALGTAKDRKVMVKTLKPVAAQLAAHEHGYLVLLTAFETVDDTVLVSKSWTAEFEQNMLDLFLSKYGRYALLYPLTGRHAKLVKLPPSAVSALDEIDQIRTATSKKDPELRRSELRAAISPTLLHGVANHAKALVEDRFGCQVVTEVLLGAVGDKTDAMEAVAALAEGDPTEKDHMAATVHGGRMLKTLVAGGFFNASAKKVDVVDPPLGFHEVLYPHISAQLEAWATGAGSFVVLGLLEAETFGEGPSGSRAQLLSVLRDPETRNRVAAAAEAGNKGAKVILEKA